MDKKAIEAVVNPALEAMGAFLVEITVSSDNDVEIVLEKDEGSISWDDCSAVDRLVHEHFSQDEEDYSLTVSSAGLDRPFKVLRQYQKALGTKVDVWMKGGKKLKGVLTAVSEETVTVDGNDVPFSVINSVRPYIEM